MEKLNNFKSTKIIVVGSDRFNNFEKVDEINYKKVSKKTYCLVLPEGFLSECLHLFQFSISYALKHPDIHFIFRLHPEMTFNELRNNSNIFKNMPKNIIMSKNDLQHDIKKSQFALYRGSTSIYFAVIKGLKPIYYELKNELNRPIIYNRK